jgi:hypothetical protein
MNEGQAPAWLDVMATLSATLGRIERRLEDEHARAVRRLTYAPAETDVYGTGWGGISQGSTQVPSSGPLVLSLGGPETGRKWIIRSLRVSDGGNAVTAVAGAANWYVGQAVVPSGSMATWVPLSPIAWRWVFPNLPNIATFTSDAQVVQNTDNLFCVITGGTANQSVLAAATIKDVDIMANLEYETT